MKIANNRVRHYVRTLTGFYGSNLFAEWTSDARYYVIYSYRRTCTEENLS